MTIKKNDWIEVEYTGKLNSGEVFDTSKDRAPLKFKVGVGMVIPGFDSAVIDLKVGDKKEFTVPFIEAYGAKNENPVEIPKESFKDVDVLEKGKSFNFMTNMGPLKIDVIDLLDDKVKAIVNHPLAGEDLKFDIEVKKIFSDKEAEELDKDMESKAHAHNHSCKDCSPEDDNCKDGCDCGHEH